ncbi:MAG: transglutaminase domain-containing protein [Thermomicrobiales bacterium]
MRTLTSSRTSRPSSSDTGLSGPTRWQRLFPEGIWPFILLMALIGLASYSVEQGDWERIVYSMTWLGLLAAFVGSVLGKSRLLDSVAHIFSMVVAFASAFFLVLVNAPDLGDGLRNRVRPLIDLTLGWYAGNPQKAGDEAYLVSMLMGIIVWLVGYLSAWTLFRRGWVMVAVLMPGILVLINLLYAPHPDKRFLAAYLLLAIPMAARYQYFLRQREWARFREASPASTGWKVLSIGAVIALLVTMLGWNAPPSLSQKAFQPMAETIGAQVDSLQARLEQALGQRANLGPQHGGAFSSFGESFEVGGALTLSDRPEVLVQGDQAPYLAAQRYDVYTGRGWTSDVDSTFQNTATDGTTYSPSMTFRTGQDVLLSSEVTGSRERSTTSVVPLVPTGNMMLTTDTYLSADRDTSVKMSWVQVNNQPWTLSGATLGTLPPDVQRLGSLLLSAPLDGESGESGPMPSDTGVAQTIAAEVDQLAKRFIVARWTAGPDGNADTLYLTGQLPVYDDVEAVRSHGEIATGQPYTVTGYTSTATVEDLMGSGTAYPAWVTDRYLDLGPTVTPRTMQLAAQLAPANLTPYERAVAIETYLRQNIVYDETVSAPPEGADIVDYVLFDRQRGYCEYYASAMVVMLRSVHVPARVVTGYYPGDWNAEQDGYVYLQKNAHAWVEVFFPGYGWIPFEPTASRPLMEQQDATSEPTATDEAAIETPDAVETLPAEQPDATPSPVVPATTGEPPALTPTNDGGSPVWAIVAGAAVVVATGFAGGMWLLWNRGLRGLSPTSALYMRLVRLAHFAGIRAAPSATPAEVASSFGEAVPSAREHADRIVRAYELDQYGPSGAAQSLVGAAAQAWTSLRNHSLRILLRRRL